MRKMIRKQFLSAVMVCIMFVTILQTNVYADDQYTGQFTLVVENQESSYVYFAYKNHSFDAVIKYDSEYADDLIVRIWLNGTEMSEYVNSSTADEAKLSIPKEVFENYFEGMYLDLQYGLYKEDGTVVISNNSQITVQEARYTYIGPWTDDSFLVGTSGISYSVAESIYLSVNDWEHPMGCVYLPITKVDIENDDSAPDAIENIIEDGNVHITASKPGHAKVTFHYTPLDGYEDRNNGSISFYLTAMEEKIISSVEVITPVSDSIDCAVLPGEEISLKADVKSYITSAEGKEYEQNTERPLKYEWTLTSYSDNDKNIELIGADKQNCTIKISKNANTYGGEHIQLNVYYMNEDGNYVLVPKSKNSNNYFNFSVSDEVYYISSDIPEDFPNGMSVGDSVEFTPVVMKKTVSGECIDEMQTSQLTVWSTGGVSIWWDIFGKYTAQLDSDSEGSFTISTSPYMGSMISKTYSFSKLNGSSIAFVGNNSFFNGKDPVTLSLNKTNFKDYERITLQKTINNGYEDIEDSEFQMSETDDMIYYTFSPEWLTENTKNSDSVEIIANAEKGENHHSEARISIQKKQQASICLPVYEASIGKNITIPAVCKGFVSDTENNYVCYIDSIKSLDENILKINRNDNGWTCEGKSNGIGNIYIEYHYYDASGKVDAVETKEINVNNSVHDTSEKNITVSKSQSVSILGDNSIGINVYWNIDAADKSAYKDALVKMSFEGETATSDKYVTLSSSDKAAYDFKCSLDVNSGEMSKTINVQLLSKYGNVIDQFTTSVESYAKKILDSNQKENDKYKPLIKAMLNYGAASQNYFGVNTDKMANRSLSSTDKTINAIPTKVINKYNENKKIELKGIKYYGTSLVVGSTIKVRHYFKLDKNVDISNYNFESDINPRVLVPHKSGDMYYVEIDTSGRNFLDKTMISVDTGYSETGAGRFFYSPINYISKAYNSKKMSPELKKLVDSQYWFQYQKEQI